jgi:hypothetical protein
MMRKEHVVTGGALELPHLKVAEKGNVAPRHDIDLEVPHVAATLPRCQAQVSPSLSNLSPLHFDSVTVIIVILHLINHN